jgi:hypothetical protein
MNLSYLTGRLVKSGPTNVGLVIMRFHPKTCTYYTFQPVRPRIPEGMAVSP